MSQGVTIKGKTPSGQNLEVKVDDQGQIYIANPGSFTIGTVNQGTAGTDPWLVALNPATLAALEEINVHVLDGTIALDAPTLAALENITVSGTVALDAPTLAALENITAVVSGTVALDAPTLAALENITAAVTGTVELGATTLAALENIVVSGTVALDAGTLAALENITVAGTVELGATTLAALENITVAGTVELGATTLAALENIVVSGTVALDAPTLAALENIIVSGTVELGATTLAALETITALREKGTTTAPTNVGTSTVVATLLAANAARIKATVYNDSLTGILLIKEGAGASLTSFTHALSPATATSPGGELICDDYTGVLTGILTAGTGTARVGET